jgi:hypothetical protein
MLPRGRVWLLLIITTLANLAVMIGGVWDVNFHRAVRVDTFFSPPHLLIYTGMVGLLAGSLVVMGLLAWDAYSNNTAITAPPRPLLLVPLFGSGGFLAAGPFDAAWHAMFGRDMLSTWTVPHATLTTFGALCGVGAVALGRWLRATRPAGALISSRSPRALMAANGFIILGLAAVVYYLWSFVIEWELGKPAIVPVLTLTWLYMPLSALFLATCCALMESCTRAWWWPALMFLIGILVLQKIPSLLIWSILGYPDAFWFHWNAILGAVVFCLSRGVERRWSPWARWCIFAVGWLSVTLIARLAGFLPHVPWAHLWLGALTVPLTGWLGQQIGAAGGRLITRLSGDFPAAPNTADTPSV